MVGLRCWASISYACVCLGVFPALVSDCLCMPHHLVSYTLSTKEFIVKEILIRSCRTVPCGVCQLWCAQRHCRMHVPKSCGRGGKGNRDVIAYIPGRLCIQKAPKLPFSYLLLVIQLVHVVGFALRSAHATAAHWLQ